MVLTTFGAALGGHNLLERQLAVDQQLARFGLVVGLARGRVRRVGQQLLYEVADLSGAASVDQRRDLAVSGGEVTPSMRQHRIERLDGRGDVSRHRFRARCALLREDLLVLALLLGVLAVLLPSLLAPAPVGRVALALLIASAKPPFTVGGQLVTDLCLFESFLLAAIALALFPPLSSERLALRHETTPTRQPCRGTQRKERGFSGRPLISPRAHHLRDLVHHVSSHGSRAHDDRTAALNRGCNSTDRKRHMLALFECGPAGGVRALRRQLLSTLTGHLRFSRSSVGRSICVRQSSTGCSNAAD
jgi:hypothetical protein